MLLRLVYLGLTNTFALLRLLPMSNQDKDTEILVLRHQIAVLQRQLGGARPGFTLGDRALLAALLHRLPRQTLHRLRLLVRPGTDPALASQSAPPTPRQGVPTETSRPTTYDPVHPSSRPAPREGEPRAGGYRRIHGELLVLDITVAASTVWQILTDARIDPTPGRASSTRAPRSSARRLRSCWLVTSSKRSPWPAPACTCWP